MAKLDGELKFTGKMGDLSAYKMRGHDAIILRAKGGMNKKQVKRMPHDSLLRLSHTEWSGCVKAGKGVRMALSDLTMFKTYNISGPLNGVCKAIQKLDSVSVMGQRKVEFTKHGYLLEGFNLSRENTFDNIVRTPFSYEISRETGSATIQVPDLIPQVQIRTFWQWPLFRLAFRLCVISDAAYKDLHSGFQTAYDMPHGQSVYTEYCPVKQKFTAREINLQIPNMEKMTDTMSLMLAVGYQMGTPIANSEIDPVPYASAAKIVAVR